MQQDHSVDCPSATSRPLACIGLDDSPVYRSVHQVLFNKFLGADCERSASLGSKPEEIELFVDVALGHRSTNLAQACLCPADVVVLDRDICDEDGLLITYGEDVAKHLRRAGFSGLIVLLTASSEVRFKQLQQMSFFDLVIHKSAALSDVAHCISRALNPTSPTTIERRSRLPREHPCDRQRSTEVGSAPCVFQHVNRSVTIAQLHRCVNGLHLFGPLFL